MRHTRVMTPNGLGTIQSVNVKLDNEIIPLTYSVREVCEAELEGQNHLNNSDIVELAMQVEKQQCRSYVDAAEKFARFILDRRILPER